MGSVHHRRRSEIPLPMTTEEIEVAPQDAIQANSQIYTKKLAQ